MGGALLAAEHPGVEEWLTKLLFLRQAVYPFAVYPVGELTIQDVERISLRARQPGSKRGLNQAELSSARDLVQPQAFD